MFKKIKNLVAEQTNKITRDPAYASRAALAGILILGIFSLSFNLGSEVIPELFSARISPPIEADLKKAAEAKALADQEIKGLVAKCAISRTAENYKTFLGNFETSMSGILPGAGNLLASYPAAISERKEQLTLEVLKKYSNLKFCIPEEGFEALYHGGYFQLVPQTSIYLQVYLNENEEVVGDYPLAKINLVDIGTLSSELDLMIKDLLMTKRQVVAIIDSAIESAIELDKQTSDKVTRLATVTTNRLVMTTNTALQQLGDVGKEGNLIDASISGMTSDIRAILAIDNTVPNYVPPLGGGSYERPLGEALKILTKGKAVGHKAIYSSDINLDQLGLPAISEAIQVEVTRLVSSDEISYGLLNLFKTEDHPNMAEQLGVGIVLYVSAMLNLDPFTPGSEKQVALIASKFATDMLENIPTNKQLCYSVDPKQENKKCFDFSPVSIPTP